LKKNGKRTGRVKKNNNENIKEELAEYIKGNINEINHTVVLVFVAEEISENSLFNIIREHRSNMQL